MNNQNPTEPITPPEAPREGPDPVEAALHHAASKIKPNPHFIERLSDRLRARRRAPQRTRVPLWGWLGAALAAALVFGLIGQALWPGGTTPGTPAATTIAENPPAVTPTREPEPAWLASLPPLLTDIFPQPGQEVAASAAIVLHFAAPMDRPSVEQALRVTPEVEGDFIWADDQTLTFQPKVLAAATAYRVALSAEARGSNGLPLARDLAFTFSTFSPLTVTHTTPAEATADLRADTPVLVAFNYPVAPLNCTGQVADADTGCPPLELTFSPNLVGQGFWVNTSVYRFDPLPAWDAGLTYTATLAAGLASVDGATLDTPVSWHFTTAPPRLLTFTPGRGDSNIPLETGLSLTFNTPMDAAATAAAFSLTAPGGVDVPLTYAWSDNGGQVVFTPTRRLDLDTRYTATLAATASAVGGAPLADAAEWTFTTAPYPAIQSITPQNDELNLYSGLTVVFAGLIDSTSIEDHLSLTQGDTPVTFNTWWDDYGQALTVYWDKDPSTEYCLTVRPGITDRYGNRITTERRACFTSAPLEPLFVPAAANTDITLDAAEAPRLYFVTTNARAIALSLYTLPERGMVGYESDPDQLLRQWTLTPENSLDQVAVAPVDLLESGTLAPGPYLLRWAIPGVESYRNNEMRIAVVDRHVTLKVAQDEALIWVTDLRGGQPLAGVPVRLVNEYGAQVGVGVTDADGIARFAIPPLHDRWAPLLAVTGVAGQPGFGVASNAWNRDASPWDFGIDGQFYESTTPFQVYIQTDRPIYRPGQLVHTRGIMRADDDARYSLPPAGQELLLTLRDANWNVAAQSTVTLSDMGTFAADFTLADDAPLGGYAVEAQRAELPNDQTWSVNFSVAAYRKPEFEVNVTPEQTDLLQGDTLRALVEGAYYSGGPVSNAPLHWVVRARTYDFQPDVSGWWSWSNSAWWDTWQDPNILAEGDARTDAQGRFWLELPTELRPLYESAQITSQNWTVEATLTDESGFPVTGQGEAAVHAARFYLGLRPESWVAQAGEPADINVLALDGDEVPVANQVVQISLAKRIWRYIESTEPFRSGDWVYSDTVESTLTVTTDAQGAALAAVTPPSSGYYVVIAESTDADGHPTRSETGLWVAGPQAAAWQTTEGKITPVADARSYRPGDTARILLPTPFTGPYEVLLTVERGGILDVRHLSFTEANPLIELPITEDYVPNIIVSFVVVKGVDATQTVPDVRVGLVELDVEPVRQALTVEITPDRDTPYLPGDRVTLTVRTLDHTGEPVAAEVALAVVDKAVLALADPNVPTLMDSFYHPRPLGVIMGDSNIVLFNRAVADLEALAANADRIAKEALLGGIGGGGGDGSMAITDVRQDFPDTTYWEAQLRTDATGEARVTFDLPDSLTTWVADARAVTADTRVGEATTEFIVSKPLLVRAVTPRFFTAGDRAEVAAVVHNNTDADITATVRLEALGVTPESAPEQQIGIPAHGRARVAWTVAVPVAGSEAALLTFSAEGSGYQDAARPNVGRESDHALPIYRYETPEVMGTIGALTETGSRLEAIIIPPDAGPETALTVRIEPTLAAGMTDALTHLEHFEHECTEQLISRFLPNVMTYRALQSLGLDDAGLRAQLETLIPQSMEKLTGRQNPDGGWGWWSERSDFQTSAYATFALVQAQRAGFAVDPTVLSNGLDYVSRSLGNGLRGDARTLPQAFALYVLTEADQDWPAGADTKLYEDRHLLETTGRAYLALALGLRDPEDPRVATLLDELRADAEITATGAHWESADAGYWVTWTRATSIVLDALTRLAPDDPLPPQAVRWLMVARQADRWETTQETAWAVIALTDYMVASGELQADYNWGVALNGERLGEGAVTDENRREPVEFTIPVGQLLREWPNALELYRGEGAGTLYYTADLALYRPVDSVAAESRGVAIQRQYCAVESAPSATPWGEDLAPCTPVTSAKPGQLIEVRLTLVLPRMRTYLLVEDHYPAGMEPVDPTLNTEIDVPSGEVSSPERGWWQPTFDHQELRDERAVFYASYLAAGTYEVRYFLRGAIPGEYRVLPATASEMYFPEVWGRTEGEVFRVEP